jgi:hypothetical protein
MAFMRSLLFFMRRDRECRPEHEPGGQQPNSDHFKYPATGVAARDFVKTVLNGCELRHCSMQRRSKRA